MYLQMAWREEPLRSPRDLMAATIISAYFGWAAAGGAADFFWPVVVPLGGIAILNSCSKDEIAYNQFFLKKITSVNLEYCITLYTD